jgi:two-component system, NtrC family, sensor histidine kinase KinB
MSLNQRLIAGLLLLVALITTVALLAVSILHGGAAQARLAHTATLISLISILAAILIAVGTGMAVLGPLRRAAQQMRAIGQGNLEQRLEWSADDSLGHVANDVNRMVVHVRDLRETEFGRKQMEHQLSDAVVQSIFEPVIVTDARGQVLKLNTAAEQLLGEKASDRMALANTPGGEKILKAVRDAVSMQRRCSRCGLGRQSAATGCARRRSATRTASCWAQ